MKVFFKILWLAGVLGCYPDSPAIAQKTSMKLVAANDCGVVGSQPFLVKGDNYTMPQEVKGSDEARTCNFGNTVIYAFNSLDIHADYQLEVVYLADHERRQRIVADGNEVQAPVILEAGKEQRYRIDLPRKAYAYGQLVLILENAGRGDNAIVSALKLYSSNSKSPEPFLGEERRALANTLSYQVDTRVDAEKVLPVYSVIPASVSGTYQPVLPLNESWLFCPRPGEYFYSQPVDTGWHPIVVPGQWSMQGFRVDSACFAGYRRTFAVPNDWKDRQVKLRFDGVASECRVYLNGKDIGYHLGGMTPFEIDVTPELIQGDNELALAVRSESLADMLGSLTQYAAHQLGGITRKVTLFAVPRVYLSDIRIETGLDDHYRNAELKVMVAVTNATTEMVKDAVVRFSVGGLPVVAEKVLPRLLPGETWKGVLTALVERPQLWSNERPVLYPLNMELSRKGEVTEMIEKRFGFREIEVRENELLVNGRAVKLRGVCRHEVHPLTGRVMSSELQRQDVELYRAANCNFIRTSHYPPCEEMLELCDESGMFVEVEAPVCWVGHHANENWKKLNYQDSIYYPYVLQVNMEMIQFYRNHPSVLFWSMANESLWNKEFAQIQEYVLKADCTRPHSFHDQAYGGFNNQGSTAPIANIHYPGPGGYKMAARIDRPMVYGEYCHLNVYNRSELVTDPGVRSDWALALAPAWEKMYQTKGVLGGSIWSGIDDIFQLPDGQAVGYGAWGPIDGWRRTKPEYWDMKKIYSPVRVNTIQLPRDRELSVEVENRYTYLNLDELKIDWRYGEEEGRVMAAIAPGEKGVVRIPVAYPDSADALYLSFTDPRGFVADEYLIPVGEQGQQELPDLQSVPARLKTDKNRFIIYGKNFYCTVSRTTGQILSLEKHGKEVLNGGPWLMVLPLTGGGCYPNHNANTPVYNDWCSDWKAASVDARKEGEEVVITVKGSYRDFSGSYALKVNANCELSVTYQFKSLGEVNPRQWGLVFCAPVDFNRTFWRRKGMWSVYPADHISRPVGEAELFYRGLPEKLNPRVKPSWAWSMDFNELGSNDFRATRRNVWYAGLRDTTGIRITVCSDGEQHWRSWLDKDKICFLVADFVTAGNEMFLESYYAPYRKPLKKDDDVMGKVKLRIGNE